MPSIATGAGDFIGVLGFTFTCKCLIIFNSNFIFGITYILHHTDRRLGVPWGHVEFCSKDEGIGIVVIGVGRRFKSRVKPAMKPARNFGTSYLGSWDTSLVVASRSEPASQSFTSRQAGNIYMQCAQALCDV